MASNEVRIATNSITKTIHVVAVTNIVASTNHIAVGTNVITFTAQMTPVAAGEHVFWNLPNGGGTLTTNQGLTTSLVCDQPGEILVMAYCGSSFVTTTIKVYAVSSVTASESPSVVAGGEVTFTATTIPDNCPLPLTWTGATGTGLTATNTFAPGNHLVEVSLGSSTQTVSIASVGVKELKYLVDGYPQSWTNLMAGGTNAGLAVGSVLQVMAVPDPEDATFPSGQPVWSGEATGTGPTATATFSTASTNSDDFKLVTATSGSSSKTEQVLVYQIDSISVATNHIAIGTNTLTLTAKTTPAGGEHLVSWACTNTSQSFGQGGILEVTCNQSGSFTFVATCGTSSANTNINVYAVTGLTASESLVAAGELVEFTATTDPANCPLPLKWSVGTSTGLIITEALPAGTHVVTVSLGTSTQTVSVVSVGVKEIQYSMGGGGWQSWTNLTAGGIPVGTTLQVKALPEPEGATFPAGEPVWTELASGTGPTATATFSTASADGSDFQKVTATCGTSSKTEEVLVFKVDTISAATNHIAIGNGPVAVTAVMKPESGGEQFVVWSYVSGTNAPVAFGQGGTAAFPANQAGSFTVRATCGSSSATTVIKVYAVTRVSPAANKVAVSNAVDITAITEPANCPLPITWVIGGTYQAATSETITATFNAIGTYSIEAWLGTSVASTNVRVLKVDIVETNIVTFAGKPTPVTFHAINSATGITWTISPSGSGGPSIVTSSDSSVEILPGANSGTFTVKAESSEVSGLSDTATLTIVGVTITVSNPTLANDAPAMGVTFVNRRSRSMAQVSVTTTPATPDIPFRFEIVQMTPETEDRGSFVQIPAVGDFVVTGTATYAAGGYQIGYLTKKELKSHRNRMLTELQSQSITIGVFWGDDSVGTKLVSCNGHFKWLYAKNLFQEAVEFTNTKYDVGISGPLYDAAEADLGATSSWDLTVTIGETALAMGENWTAAVLYHEGVHVAQGGGAILDAAAGETTWEEWRTAGFAPEYLTTSLTNPSGFIKRARILAGAGNEMAAWSSMLGVVVPFALIDDPEVQNINSQYSAYDLRVTKVNATP